MKYQSDFIHQNLPPIKKLHHTHTQNDRNQDKRSYEQQQRKEIQATGTTTKATNTQSRTTGIRQQTPKGMRNHTKTGTKEAQTTDNRTEGSTEK